MNVKEVNCPFCGSIVDNNAVKCSSCGSIFSEPQLPGIKFKDFNIFLFLYILMRGWFGVFWLLVNTPAINKLTTNTKDKLKFNWLLLLLIVDMCIYLCCFADKIPLGLANIISITILYIIFAGLSYRILRIIQKYSYQTYGILPEINLNYVIFFNIFYLIHFIDTYTNRIWEIHEHFKMKAVHWIMLILIFSIAPMAIFAFNPPLSVAWETFKNLIKF